jgi:CheY-like chemotaxis protein
MEPMKVLVADDDNLNRMMISRLLEKIGLQCAKAENGQVALDMSMQDEYQIIFLDYNMPLLSGAQCAEMIRQEYASRVEKAPVLVCVSADEVDDDDEGIFDFYLSKPFKVEMVQSIINNTEKEV